MINTTGNEDMTRIRNCETLRNGCESLRRHHWAVCEAARNRRESAAKPAKAPRNPRKRRESAAKKLRIRVISSLPVGFPGSLRMQHLIHQLDIYTLRKVMKCLIAASRKGDSPT